MKTLCAFVNWYWEKTLCSDWVPYNHTGPSVDSTYTVITLILLDFRSVTIELYVQQHHVQYKWKFVLEPSDYQDRGQQSMPICFRNNLTQLRWHEVVYGHLRIVRQHFDLWDIVEPNGSNAIFHLRLLIFRLKSLLEDWIRSFLQHGNGNPTYQLLLDYLV